MCSSDLLALSVHTAEFNDLSPFRLAPFTKVNVAGTQVDDLAPLQNMPLTFLDIRGTRVTDLSVLKGMPLTRLDAARVRATWANAPGAMEIHDRDRERLLTDPMLAPPEGQERADAEALAAAHDKATIAAALLRL